jgi:F-type H+-transporting ATPase subunit epsilon
VKLVISTPLAVVLDVDGVRHLKAEDESGSFGILAGHADFLTTLPVSVVTWRDGDGHEHHAAVGRGMLEVRDGATISVAVREAVLGDDLHQLETDVLAQLRRRTEEEKAARIDVERLYLSAVRQILKNLRPETSPQLPDLPPADAGKERNR